MRYTIVPAGIILAGILAVCSQTPPENQTTEKKTRNENVREKRKMLSYDDFLAHLEKIRPGTGKKDVETVLGKPDSGSDSLWAYDMTGREGFPGMPPSPGTTVFPGITITFDNGLVKNISKNWIDATGPKPGL